MSLEKEIKQKINSARHEALLNIVHTNNYLQKFSRFFFDKLGITEAQYNIMIIIKLENRKLTQVEISERMVSSRSNITSLIDKLQEKNYVRRLPLEGDRRVYQVELTDKGMKKLAEVEPAYVKTVEKIMECFSVEESRQLSSLLVKIRKNLKEKEVNKNDFRR
ncbi:MAG: MarR family transcriptional regulator [Candidatus Omnitrophica bacterium]|nr:MarR family transcriptional regulator [Candidatus Omnitrophota bacterium]